MSWIDRITSGLTITTGDGQVYTPDWLNAQKAVEYNISEFNFPDVEGTLVYRGTPMGRRFPMEIYFQGENHLDTALAFEESAKDPRPWVVSHPFYDDILVHPTSLNFDNTRYNVSKITGTLLETLSDVFPKSTQTPKDKIEQDQIDTQDDLAEDYVSNVPEPQAADISKLQENNTSLYNKARKAITDTVQAEEFRNLFQAANSALAAATIDPLNAIRSAQATLAYPSQFATRAQNRIATLTSSFNTLRDSLENLTRRGDKFIYETSGATVLGAMALSAATPLEGDYNNRNDVVDVIESLTGVYNQYLLDLDGLQTDNGGSEDSYIPSPKGLFHIGKLFNYTLSTLFEIAIGEAHERSVILTEKSNAIILTHRFYGLDEFDANLDQFINQNSIGLNELLEIDEGRKVIYYV